MSIPVLLRGFLQWYESIEFGSFKRFGARLARQASPAFSNEGQVSLFREQERLLKAPDPMAESSEFDTFWARRGSLPPPLSRPLTLPCPSPTLRKFDPSPDARANVLFYNEPQRPKRFMGATTVIYYVEDDTNIRDLTVYALKQAGFDAAGFPAAGEFFAACKERLPELVLLDIMLPEIDGLEILHMLRENPATKHLPVMMLTAKGTEFDTVSGLDAGADDYLAKPFGMMELVSRVNALMRRASAPPVVADDELSCGSIELCVSSHTVQVAGEPIALTLKEFDLLHTLLQNQGHVLSRSQLLEDVWGMTYVGETRTVDVHVQTLRQKLAAAQEGADALIRTVRGVGYCIKPAS